MLTGEDLAGLHHNIRTGTGTAGRDRPAVGQQLGEHGRHDPYLPQPGTHATLEHTRNFRVVRQPHRSVVHARERHPMTGGEPGEPVRRGQHHLMLGSK